MYEGYFGFSKRPFQAVPSAESYVSTPCLEHARQTLHRSIDRAEGPAIVVGPTGTGKSVLCHRMAADLRGRFSVVQLAGTHLSTRRALLQNILFELKLPYRQMDEGELRLSLVDFLEPGDANKPALVLIVDEAHTLPLRLLDEVRMISGIVRGSQMRVHLIMAGTTQLEERLASPKLDSFNQRLAARCFTQPLNREETREYIASQLGRVGANIDHLLAPEAIRAIYAATDGIVRLVNQVCDHALMLAAVGGHRYLYANAIEEAWADLQQLPAPWHDVSRASNVIPATSATVEATSVIEFGSLDDDELPAAGTSSDEVASELDEKLASIDHQLKLAAADESDEMLDEDARAEAAYDAEIEAANEARGITSAEFSPATAVDSPAQTEVELFFSVHDPFGTGFDEEEVVIDRYASLQSQAALSVSSYEGREIGRALAAAYPEAQPAPSEEVIRMDGQSHASSSQSHDEFVDLESEGADLDFDPSSDPVMPDVVEPQRTQRTIPLDQFAADDRDMIVIDEQVPAHLINSLTPRARKQEYRRLFSTLRSR